MIDSILKFDAQSKFIESLRNSVTDSMIEKPLSTLSIRLFSISYIFHFFLFFLFALPAFSQECNQTFTLQTQEELSALEILNELAQSCKLNIIYEDSLAREILSQNKPKLHIQNLKAQDLLNLLLESSHLHHTLDDQILKITFLYTQTYELNYVSTSRIGSSSTDVVLSPNPSTQEYSNSPFQSIDQPLSTHPSNSGRSGTKIQSIDENNFWGEIQKELSEIAYRPEDLFIDKIPKAITINKNAGLLTITASQTQHKRIKNYLNQLNSKMHTQVLINVHIFLIRHNKSNTAGINWNELSGLGNLMIPSDGGGSLQISNGGINLELNVLHQGVSLTKIIEFLQSYGETKSLSNPRVLTLNNQPAIISVGSVLRYTQNSVYQSSSQGSNIQNSIETYPSIFAGVLLDVTPSIQNDEIILKINPSITRTKNTSLENEPNALKSPPNLSTNQLSSIIKVKDGEKIILGGLISDLESKKEFKVPLLGDIPLLRYLFRYKWNHHLSEEMVMIISPKIIRFTRDSKPSPNQTADSIKGLIQSVQFESLRKES